MPLHTAEGWRSSDDASSIYSRSPDCPKAGLRLDEIPKRLHTRHDLPEINSLDHQIALARGSTMALETTRTRLRCSKSRHRLSLPETKEEKIRQLNEQEAENEFYRRCHDIFQQLSVTVLDVIEVSQDLALQCHYDSELSISAKTQIWQQMTSLRGALEQSRSREALAEQDWKRKWNISRVWSPSTRWI